MYNDLKQKFFSRTPPEEEFVLPSLPQMDPRLLSNAPPELLRSHSYQPPPGQSIFYPPVMGPKYAWSPRMPGRTHGPLPPDSRMYSDNSRHMYPMQHPYYGSREMLQQQQQQQQQQECISFVKKVVEICLVEERISRENIF